MCCASAADPPLPATSTFFPDLYALTIIFTADSIQDKIESEAKIACFVFIEV